MGRLICNYIFERFIQNLFHIQVLQCIIFPRFELLHIDGFSLETILIRHLATLAPYQPDQGHPRLPLHDVPVPSDGEEGDLRDQQRHLPHGDERRQADQARVQGRKGEGMLFENTGTIGCCDTLTSCRQSQFDYHILEICVRRAIFCTVPPYFYAYLLLL